MKTIAIAVLSLLFTLPMAAQDTPTRFVAAGLGFQGSATAHASGWLTICSKVTDVPLVAACVRTDYAGQGVTSTRAEAHPLIREIGPVRLFGTVGAGAATGVTGGVGASFDAGGVAVVKLPEKLGGKNGFYAVFSGSWQKNDVLQQPDLGSALKTFGSQSVWRFGVGRQF